AHMLGADLGLAALALADMMPVEGRGQRHLVTVSPDVSFWVVDESYNANPASMRAALDTLGNFSIEPGEGRSGRATRLRGRRIAVLGDMRELGDAGPRLHAALAQAIDDADVDLVLTVGELMRHLWDALPGHLRLAHVATAAEAADVIAAEVKASDIVMVKGSQSMGMIKVVNALRDLGRAPAEPASSKQMKG
ncbi:MAG TPA: cyanophycin synthetase, partial [Sphingomonadales bacterium]